jgi:hypothetical protein
MTSASPEPMGAPGVVERIPSAMPPPPPKTAPYFPPPSYPPAAVKSAPPTHGRAMISIAAAILGIVLGLPFGLPGLAFGTLGYFMGKSAIARIDGEPGTAGGRGLAVTGSALGIVATAIGAIVSLAWLVLILVSLSATQTFQ